MKGNVSLQMLFGHVGGPMLRISKLSTGFLSCFFLCSSLFSYACCFFLNLGDISLKFLVKFFLEFFFSFSGFFNYWVWVGFLFLFLFFVFLILLFEVCVQLLLEFLLFFKIGWLWCFCWNLFRLNFYLDLINFTLFLGYFLVNFFKFSLQLFDLFFICLFNFLLGFGIFFILFDLLLNILEFFLSFSIFWIFISFFLKFLKYFLVIFLINFSSKFINLILEFLLFLLFGFCWVLLLIKLCLDILFLLL